MYVSVLPARLGVKINHMVCNGPLGWLFGTCMGLITTVPSNHVSMSPHLDPPLHVCLHANNCTVCQCQTLVITVTTSVFPSICPPMDSLTHTCTRKGFYFP